jgi:hypothetical protein
VLCPGRGANSAEEDRSMRRGRPPRRRDDLGFGSTAEHGCERGRRFPGEHATRILRPHSRQTPPPGRTLIGRPRRRRRCRATRSDMDCAAPAARLLRSRGQTRRPRVAFRGIKATAVRNTVDLQGRPRVEPIPPTRNRLSASFPTQQASQAPEWNARSSSAAGASGIWARRLLIARRRSDVRGPGRARRTVLRLHISGISV